MRMSKTSWALGNYADEQPLESSFMLFDFHHDVVYIDEITTTSQSTERGVRKYLLEPMVVLDELCQRTLKENKYKYMGYTVNYQ